MKENPQHNCRSIESVTRQINKYFLNHDWKVKQFTLLVIDPKGATVKLAFDSKKVKGEIPKEES